MTPDNGHTAGLTIRDYGEPVALLAAECQFALLDGPDGAPVAYVYRREDAALYAGAPALLEALRRAEERDQEMHDFDDLEACALEDKAHEQEFWRRKLQRAALLQARGEAG